MDFNRSVYCNWSHEKHQKWKEWNKQFSDDDIVIEGAKSKSFENTAFLIAPISMSIVIFSMIFIVDYIEKRRECSFSSFLYIYNIFKLKNIKKD